MYRSDRDSGEPGRAETFEPGELFSDRFRVDRQLGRGVMGEVWLAFDIERDDAPVTIEVLPHAIARDARSVARLGLEVLKKADLRHPHILHPRYLERAGTRRGGDMVVCLVTPRVEGRSLHDLLAEHPGGLPWDRVLPWADQIASAIDFAHERGILHRDINPRNIVVAEDGDGAAWLANFGVAHEVREAMAHLDGVQSRALWPLQYMSPQKFRGGDSAADDRYAWSMTLYEALTGAPAFRSGGFAESLIWQVLHAVPRALQNVPSAVSAAIVRGLAKETSDRPSSCAAQLDEAVGGRAPGGMRISDPVPETIDLSGDGRTAPGRRAGDVLTVRLRSKASEPEASLRFRWVPPGSFLMGSPDDEAGRRADEGPQRMVTFARGFWLQETPLTRAQWNAIMPCEEAGAEGEAELALPMEYVTWYRARYAIAVLNRVRFEGAAVKWRFRLPSESEWEFACRAGTTTPFHFGNTIITDQANHNYGAVNVRGGMVISRGGTMAVGSFPPNAWGLQDMHGNVAEWCADGYRDSYAGAPTDGSAVSGVGGEALRVTRGGSWADPAVALRSASRDRCSPETASNTTGLRLVLEML